MSKQFLTAPVRHIICPVCQAQNPNDARYCVNCGAANLVLNDDLPTHDTRRYFITRVLKQGGQGSVYEGVDQDGNIYAIKEMRDNFTDPRERAEATRRFNTEADILQQVRHDSVPRIYSHFTDEGKHYLTMDFVRGEDLETVLEREPRLSEARVIALARQLCDVLSYLHQQGLVYRDVKPSNIMFEKSGRVKLVDFGIAKLFNPTDRGGTQIGTPGYAPPEQYQGLATPVSDVYALGATLHHLLTGRDPTEEQPFSFPPVQQLVPTVSPHVSAAIATALQMKPEDRFQSMQAFWSALASPPAAMPAAARAASPATPSTMRSAPPTTRTPPPPTAPPTSRAPGRTGTVPLSQPPVPPPLPSQAPPPTFNQPSTAAPPPPAHPPRKQQRGGWVRRLIRATRRAVLLLVLLFVVLAGAGIAVAVFYPDVLPPAVQAVLPLPDREVQVGRPQALEFEVEATVPSNADDAAILAALRDAYREQLQAEYPGARVNQSVPITRQGDASAVGSTADETTYRATMSGFVALPE